MAVEIISSLTYFNLKGVFFTQYLMRSCLIEILAFLEFLKFFGINQWAFTVILIVIKFHMGDYIEDYCSTNFIGKLYKDY